MQIASSTKKKKMLRWASCLCWFVMMHSVEMLVSEKISQGKLLLGCGCVGRRFQIAWLFLIVVWTQIDVRNFFGWFGHQCVQMAHKIEQIWPDCCVLGSDQCSKKKKSNTTFRARCPKSIWRTNFSQRMSQFDNYQLCCSGICNEWLVGVMVGLDTLFLLRCLFLHFSFVLEIAMQVKNFLAKEEWVVHIDSFQIWAKKFKKNWTRQFEIIGFPILTALRRPVVFYLVSSQFIRASRDCVGLWMSGNMCRKSWNHVSNQEAVQNSSGVIHWCTE